MNTLDSKKIIDQMVDLRNLAKRNRWELAYDQENDQLYYAPKQIPKGVTLHSFGDEFALYLDNLSNVNGIFIEYFSSNFSEHEKEFKKIVELLDNDKDGYRTSRDNESDEVKLAENALTGEALKSVYTFFETLEKKAPPVSASDDPVQQ